MSIKIKYIGDISPIRIRALSAVLDDWKKGEVRDLDDAIANKILKDNVSFSRVNGSSTPKVKKSSVKYNKEQLFDKTEEQQEVILKELGLSEKEIRKLDREFQKVNKILEIQ